MKYFSILCEGQGDTYFHIVNEEMWKWINNENTECPEKIKRQIYDYRLEEENEGPYEKFEIHISKWCVMNDKALASVPIKIKEKRALFFNTKDFTNFCLKNKIKITDSFEGYVY
jgi:hypothetical protein